MGDVFGVNVRAARQLAGLSLDDLAEAAGMSKSGVWEVEKGRNDPRLSTIRRLASALGVDVVSLLSVDDLSPSLTQREMRVLHAMRGGYDGQQRSD